MKVYHQGGHNLIWNKDSLMEDNAGSGIILSPVNDGPDKILALSSDLRHKSMFDSQFYVPSSKRGKLSDYHFFPSAALQEFSTVDFETECWDVAKNCVKWQVDAGFKTIIIPTRHYENLPANYLDDVKRCYLDPFMDAIQKIGFDGCVLLTTIVKPSQLIDEDQKNYLLNWMTGIENINGFYVIFEYNSPQKQIKDPIQLANSLNFIRSLRENDLEVHIAYNNTEGILYSLADPTSISMGSYENLRRFGAGRFREEEKQIMAQPNPRLYSGVLLQSIEFTYVQAIQRLYSGWRTLFEKSKYTPENFKPKENWNLKQPDLYKHFFLVFSEQVSSLPPLNERFTFLTEKIKIATEGFDNIRASGVVLDSNSDGSHLASWATAMNLFKGM